VPKETLNALNVGALELNLDVWLKERPEQVRSSGDGYVLNLTALGIDKLLGGGKITKKFNITVSRASAKAKEKLESAGGKVISEQQDEVKPGTEKEKVS
jgi:large subunit ribosomal protein L15